MGEQEGKPQSHILYVLKVNTSQVGERRVSFIYSVLVIGLELVVWLVPSLVGGSVAISIIGVLMGPMYPIAMNHSGRIIPGWLLTGNLFYCPECGELKHTGVGSIGWIAALGQTGSAFFPFLTGAIASKAGIGSLQPL